MTSFRPIRPASLQPGYVPGQFSGRENGRERAVQPLSPSRNSRKSGLRANCRRRTMRFSTVFSTVVENFGGKPRGRLRHKRKTDWKAGAGRSKYHTPADVGNRSIFAWNPAASARQDRTRARPRALTVTVGAAYHWQFTGPDLPRQVVPSHFAVRTRHEAHVSTEQPPSAPHARLPRSNEHEERTARPQAPSRQGAKAIERVFELIPGAAATPAAVSRPWTTAFGRIAGSGGDTNSSGCTIEASAHMAG